MHKVLGFIRRRPDFTFADFSQHWRTTHRAEALKLTPWLKGYVQNHFLPGPMPDIQRPADGCPELWVEHPEDMMALATSPEFLTGACLDEPRFMEGRSSGLAVREEIAIPGNGPIKLMLFLGVNAGAELGQFWPTTQASGHIRNHRLPDQQLDPAFDFDLVDEIWWPDAEACVADCAAAPAIADCPWAAPHRLKAALVNELTVIPPAWGSAQADPLNRQQ